MKIISIIIFVIFLTGCTQNDYRIEEKYNQSSALSNTQSVPKTTPAHQGSIDKTESKVSLININGNTIQQRFKTSEGYERIAVPEGSFAAYLRKLPLKPDGSTVKLYNGLEKASGVYEAVIDMDIGDKDLQQCADAVMRLRGEYFYNNHMYEKIHFNFTNGFKADYITWMKGNRIKVEGNKVNWVKRTDYANDYNNFRQYMDIVFSYAGTLSLSQEMKKVSAEEMNIGDVFIKGGSPGHCVLIVDMAVNKATGKKVFIIAQSYMPAQDIHILKNLENDEMSPWYPLDFGVELYTPEWNFNRDQLTLQRNLAI